MAIIARVSSGYDGSLTDLMMSAQRNNQRSVRGSLHVELQESPETAEIFNKDKLFLCLCEVLCVLPLVRSSYIQVQFPGPVWRNSAPLVSCLYFSTLVFLHFDYSHELRLGSITASSQWIQASVLLFTSAKPCFLPQLQSGITNTFMLAQIIVPTWMWSRLLDTMRIRFYLSLSQARQLFYTAPGWAHSGNVYCC